MAKRAMSEQEKPNDSDFYVGYQALAPRAIARWLRSRLLWFAAVAAAALGAFAGSQDHFHDSRFEFGNVSTVQGYLVSDPYPALLIPAGNEEAPAEATVRIHLVGGGKKGADISDWHNQFVKLSGTLIERDQQSMLELVAGSIETANLPGPAPSSSTLALGQQTLVGEIVDSKCHLGVMKPGEGEAHRACAIRCISGGLPPMLVSRDTDGNARYMLLTNAEGEVFDDELLPKIGRAVRITGMVYQRDDTLFMRAATDAIVRL